MDFFTDLWAIAKQSGFSTMLLLLGLYMMNEERKLTLKKNEELTERLYQAMQDATSAIKDLRELLFRGSGPEK